MPAGLYEQRARVLGDFRDTFGSEPCYPAHDEPSILAALQHAGMSDDLGLSEVTPALGFDFLF